MLEFKNLGCVMCFVIRHPKPKDLVFYSGMTHLVPAQYYETNEISGVALVDFTDFLSTLLAKGRRFCP